MIQGTPPAHRLDSAIHVLIKLLYLYLSYILLTPSILFLLLLLLVHFELHFTRWHASPHTRHVRSFPLALRICWP